MPFIAQRRKRLIACAIRCKSGDVWHGVRLSKWGVESQWGSAATYKALSRAEMKTGRDKREGDIFLVRAKVQKVSAHS